MIISRTGAGRTEPVVAEQVGAQPRHPVALPAAPTSPGEVWVQGPISSRGARPAACSASKSASIQGSRMSYQPPTNETGAVTSPTPAEKSRATQ